MSAKDDARFLGRGLSEQTIQDLKDFGFEYPEILVFMDNDHIKNFQGLSRDSTSTPDDTSLGTSKATRKN